MLRRILEVFVILAAVGVLYWWQHRSQPVTVCGLAPGMTEAEVQQALEHREGPHPWYEYGTDHRVARVEGYTLERGGNLILERSDTLDTVRARLGSPDRERTHTTSMPGLREKAAVLIYKDLRLRVDAESGGLLFERF